MHEKTTNHLVYILYFVSAKFGLLHGRSHDWTSFMAVEVILNGEKCRCLQYFSTCGIAGKYICILTHTLYTLWAEEGMSVTYGTRFCRRNIPIYFYCSRSTNLISVSFFMTTIVC